MPLWGNHLYFRIARAWDDRVRKAAKEGAEYGGLCTISKEFRLYAEGFGKPDTKQLLQESNRIRFEVYKDHNGSMEDASNGAGPEAGK